MKLFSIAVALLLVTGCTSWNWPQLREVPGGVPAMPGEQARIYFYGDTTAWKGLHGHRLWKPSVTVDGEPIPTPNGEEVVFFADRPPGTYVIGVDNDVTERDPAAPESYAGQQVEIDARAGQAYYVKLIRHGETTYFDLTLEPRQHYLELRPVNQVLGRVEIRRFRYPTE
jgi:hypothetical protein